MKNFMLLVLAFVFFVPFTALAQRAEVTDETIILLKEAGYEVADQELALNLYEEAFRLEREIEGNWIADVNTLLLFRMAIDELKNADSQFVQRLEREAFQIWLDLEGVDVVYVNNAPKRRRVIRYYRVPQYVYVDARPLALPYNCWWYGRTYCTYNDGLTLTFTYIAPGAHFRFRVYPTWHACYQPVVRHQPVVVINNITYHNYRVGEEPRSNSIVRNWNVTPRGSTVGRGQATANTATSRQQSTRATTRTSGSTTSRSRTTSRTGASSGRSTSRSSTDRTTRGTTSSRSMTRTTGSTAWTTRSTANRTTGRSSGASRTSETRRSTRSTSTRNRATGSTVRSTPSSARSSRSGGSSTSRSSSTQNRKAERSSSQSSRRSSSRGGN